MKWSELKRIAIQNGWYLVRQGGNHEIYNHPTKSGNLIMGRHNSEEVKNGTAAKILKQINN